MQVEHKVNYTEKIVAFIDILGFKNIVSSSLLQFPEVHKCLNYALKEMKHIEKQEKNTKSDLEVSMFSDSIVLSAEKENLFSLVWTVGWLQAKLLCVGILMRGGISFGLLHHRDGILYGEGFLSAINLEKKAAIYPRIVISERLMEKYKSLQSKWIEKDFDGFSFVNPFQFNAVVGGACELAADGNDPREMYFEEVRSYLIKGRDAITEEHDLAKYRWMIKYFNIAVGEINTNSLAKFEFID